MVIDAHNHPNWWGKNCDKQIEDMNKCGIDKTWLLSWECGADEYDPQQIYLLHHNKNLSPVPFEYCLEHYNKYPDRFILGFAPDPRDPDAIDRLRAAIDLYDIKVCGEVKFRMMYDNYDAIRFFRFCGEKNLPVVLHFEYPITDNTKSSYPRPDWWYGGDMGTLERVLESCPNTNFLGHALGFWSEISNDDLGKTSAYPKGAIVGEGKIITLMKKYPNLYCDISANSGHNALSRDIEFTKKFLIEFADRIVYSRDCFHNKHQELIRSLDLPQNVLDKIFYKNAEKLISK